MNRQKEQMSNLWDRLHEQPRFRPAFPHDTVVRWAFRNFPKAERNSAEILDVGCGAGRHALFLAEEGFRVSACDMSRVGVRETSEAAKLQGLTVSTEVTSADDLSKWDADGFDGVVCFGVLYYLTLEQAVKALQEIWRVLKPGGRFLCVLRTDQDSRKQNASQISKCTWCIDALADGAPSNAEVGIPMLFFTRGEVQDMFSSFSEAIIDRMTYEHKNFVDDDWVIHARK